MKIPTETPIQAVGREQQSRVTATLTLAFAADPLLRWLFPEPEGYLEYGRTFLKRYGESGFDHETVFVIDGGTGAAVWVPPDGESDIGPIAELLSRTLSETKQTAMIEAYAELSTYRPDRPHWWLATLGVEPRFQRQGYGSRLIQPVLNRCATDSVCAYLEATSPDNRRLYERQGFEVLAQIDIETGPRLFPMRRDP